MWLALISAYHFWLVSPSWLVKTMKLRVDDQLILSENRIEILTLRCLSDYHLVVSLNILSKQEAVFLFSTERINLKNRGNFIRLWFAK